MQRMTAAQFKKEKKRSKYEIAFESAFKLCGAKGLPPYVSEYRFAPPRRWRFDFAWPELKLAVEIDGGQWLANGGRHNRDSDRQKINMATVLGWRVIRFSGQQVMNDPMECIQIMKDVYGYPTPT